MNLNYGYDKSALTALTQTADKNLQEHNLVIDFDGEVLIDPEYYFPNVPISMYQFATKINDATLRDTVLTAALYDALEAKYAEINRSANLTVSRGNHHLKIAA